VCRPVAKLRSTGAVRTFQCEATVAWAETLDNMQTVNILSALLDAAGYEEDTLRFLRKVWTFYLNPPDTKVGT
jgi:hypothetical protein